MFLSASIFVEIFTLKKKLHLQNVQRDNMNLWFKRFYILLQKYIDIFTKRKAILICVGVWIFSFVLQIPNHFGWNEYKFVLNILTYYQPTYFFF